MPVKKRISRAAGVFWRFRYHLFSTLVVLAFWDTLLIKPFRVFVVMVHEVCHAGAALLTDGEVVEIRTAWDESGHTLTKGGIFPIISSAGYVGSALLGALLIYAGCFPQVQRLALLFIGAATMGMTIWYTPAGAGDFYFGIFGGMVFVLLAIKSQRAGTAGAVWLGVMLCIYSLHDFRTDLWMYPEQTDAGILAAYWGAPPLAYPIAFTWVAVSVYAMYKSLLALVRKERKN